MLVSNQENLPGIAGSVPQASCSMIHGRRVGEPYTPLPKMQHFEIFIENVSNIHGGQLGSEQHTLGSLLLGYICCCHGSVGEGCSEAGTPSISEILSHGTNLSQMSKLFIIGGMFHNVE